MVRQSIIACLFLLVNLGSLAAGPPLPTRTPRVRVVDLDVGESRAVELCDGTMARVKLLSVDEVRDSIRAAVRRAQVKVEINGLPVELTSDLSSSQNHSWGPG
jgi:hypothetical protein